MQLLDHKFFKTAQDARYLQSHLLQGLPEVTQRMQIMRTAQVCVCVRVWMCACVSACMQAGRQAGEASPHGGAASFPRCHARTSTHARTHTRSHTRSHSPLPCAQSKEPEPRDAEILASQQEYRKGVSAWKFDLPSLKAAAAAQVRAGRGGGAWTRGV